MTISIGGTLLVSLWFAIGWHNFWRARSAVWEAGSGWFVVTPPERSSSRGSLYGKSNNNDNGGGQECPPYRDPTLNVAKTATFRMGTRSYSRTRS